MPGGTEVTDFLLRLVRRLRYPGLPPDINSRLGWENQVGQRVPRSTDPSRMPAIRRSWGFLGDCDCNHWEIPSQCHHEGCERTQHGSSFCYRHSPEVIQ